MVSVSTVIPTYNRTALLMGRAIPSVIQQAGDWECLVVGDGTERATVDAMAVLCDWDSRFRFYNLPRTEYPTDEHQRWAVQGTVPFNFGLDHAKGEFVSYLADDDAYAPNHHATLLNAAIGEWDVVCGASQVGDVLYFRSEAGPFCAVQGAYLMRRSVGLRAQTVPAELAWDAHWWLDAIDQGLKFRFIPDRVHFYYPEPRTLQFHGTALQW